MTVGEDGRFVMTFQGDADAMLKHCEDGCLRALDLAVFMALGVQMTSSGRVHTRPRLLAKRLGISHTTVYESIKRLQDNMYVVRQRDVAGGGGTYFLLNPYVSSTGSAQKRGALWQQFRAAFETTNAC